MKTWPWKKCGELQNKWNRFLVHFALYHFFMLHMNQNFFFFASLQFFVWFNYENFMIRGCFLRDLCYACIIFFYCLISSLHKRLLIFCLSSLSLKPLEHCENIFRKTQCDFWFHNEIKRCLIELLIFFMN